MKKTALIAVLGLLIIINIIFFNGISFGIGSKFFFTTKYHKNASDAFLSKYIPSTLENSISIDKQVDIIIIDENNCLLLATTADNELLVSPMISRNEKFAAVGDYYLYSYESTGDYNKNVGLIMNKTQLFNSRGTVTDTLEWCIVFDDEIPLEAYVCKNYAPDNYKNFKFVLGQSVDGSLIDK